MLHPFFLPTVGAICSLHILRSLHRLLTADCDARTHAATVNGAQFRDRTVWITGASSGIGRCLARQLAELGAHVVISARREDVLREVATEMACTDDKVTVFPLDVTQSAEKLMEAVKVVLELTDGRMDFLFNNAGVSSRADGLEVNANVIDQVMRVNFHAPVTLAQALLKANPTVTIVNTLSIASFIHTPLRSAYSAAKSATASYFQCVRLEHPSTKIISIFPGSVATPVAHNALTADGKRFGREDPGIAGGLKPERVADRMLAAVCGGVDGAVIARPKEMLAVRVCRRFPAMWKVIARRRAERFRRTMLAGEAE